jgi:hypothetical protein
MYGKSHFSNGCLMARRLVERGVRFVQVYYGNGQPWDTHSKHDEPTTRRLAADIDRPIAALLGDLKQRGCWTTRSSSGAASLAARPSVKTAMAATTTRTASACSSPVAALRGGTAYGESDDFGFKAAVDKMHIHDIHATMLHLLGMDHERLTYRYAGRDYRLTDVHGRVPKAILA